jgi:hypothetical protein
MSSSRSSNPDTPQSRIKGDLVICVLSYRMSHSTPCCTFQNSGRHPCPHPHPRSPLGNSEQSKGYMPVLGGGGSRVKFSCMHLSTSPDSPASGLPVSMRRSVVICKMERVVGKKGTHGSPTPKPGIKSQDPSCPTHRSMHASPRPMAGRGRLSEPGSVIGVSVSAMWKV